MSARAGSKVATTQRRRRGLFARSATDRVVAGVAGGLAEALGVDAVVIRLAFVVLGLAGGFGLALYLIGWLASGDPISGAPRTRPLPDSLTRSRHAVAVGFVVAGMLLLLRAAGIWFGDALVWSVALAAFGSAVIWTRSDDAGRARWTRLATRLQRGPVEAIALGRVTRWRLAMGTLLVIGGMSTFLAYHYSLGALRNASFAVFVAVAGLALILGPWTYQLARQLGDERRGRIRSEERAEVAAHLHDSVLQTLALIQRASTPEEMSTLARGQERELRAWLSDRPPASANGSRLLSAALEEAAAGIEQRHRVRIDVVAVGDATLDDRLRALVEAATEAMANAARHSGAKRISVYVEVAPDAVSAFVRDEGSGFDAARRPQGRRGIAESIVGRMERHGGVATVTSEPSEGTEVSLRMPRRAG
jgi:signal transduction histidine kinase